MTGEYGEQDMLKRLWGGGHGAELCEGAVARAAHPLPASLLLADMR